MWVYVFYKLYESIIGFIDFSTQKRKKEEKQKKKKKGGVETTFKKKNPSYFTHREFLTCLLNWVNTIRRRRRI